MRFVFFTLLSAMLLCGQSSVSSSNLPSNFAGVCLSYDASQRPHTAGCVTLAVKVSTGLYSYSTYAATSHGQTSAMTGFALVVRQVGPFTILALGQAGAATGLPTGITTGDTTSNATKVTGSLGPAIAFPFGKGGKWAIVAEAQNVSGSGWRAKLVIGRSW